MADQKDKLNVKKEGDLADKNDFNFGQSQEADLDIKSTSGSGDAKAKKSGAHELEINLKIPDVEGQRQNAINAALAAAAIMEQETANEDLETTARAGAPLDTSSIATNENKELPSETEEAIEEAKNKPTVAEQIAKHKEKTAPKKTNQTQSTPTTQADRIEQGAEQAGGERQIAKEAPQPTTPLDNSIDRMEQAVESAQRERTAAKTKTQPPKLAPPTPRAEAGGAPKIPPRISPEKISEVGPHTTPKMPPTLDQGAQHEAGGALTSKPTAPSSPLIMKDNFGRPSTDATAPATTATPSPNLDIVIASDRARKRQLGQQRRQLETELRKLDGRVDNIKSSLAMKILKFWFPGIYAAIAGIGLGTANAKDAAKIKMLEAKLISLKTAKGMLETSKATSSLIMAFVKLIKYIAASLETIIIPILLIILSPAVIVILWIIHYFILKDTITAAIDKIEKEVNAIIQNLEQILQPLLKKVNIRKQIQKINQLMAADSQTRRAYQANQPNNQTSVANQPPAANDNQESNNLPQAA